MCIYSCVNVCGVGVMKRERNHEEEAILKEVGSREGIAVHVIRKKNGL